MSHHHYTLDGDKLNSTFIKMNLDDFIWDPHIYDGFKETIIQEIFVDNIYERLFPVEVGDVVFDFGASLGPFTYSILNKNPSHVFALEPSFEEFKTLVMNTRHGPVTHINKGVADVEGEFNFEYVFENVANNKLYATTFQNIIKTYNIDKIDFLKTDCESGEYDIFNVENLFWIKQNVKKIAGEWHLRHPDLKVKFRQFRDIYLRVFPNYEIYSFNGIHLNKTSVWTEEFMNYYGEIMIYIDNR